MSDLLLDTCALLWMSQGGGGLSSHALKSINNAKFVYISAISAWEISLLTAKKQIELPMKPDEWFNELLRSQQINLIEINAEIAFLSNTLPWHHRDPADRFIIATALSQKLTVVSGDKKFKAYDINVLT